MRQKDYSIGKARQRLRSRRRRFLLALECDADVQLLLRTSQSAARARRDVGHIRLRSRHISTMRFNLNAYSEEQSLSEFRFRKSEIGTVCGVLSWGGGPTARSGYSCEAITATCIVLKRLSFPTRWRDLETVFGMRASALCEVFWEVVEGFIATRGSLIETFRSDLMHERAPLYAAAIYEKGAPLDNCAGFIDCTKIQMSRPGGRGSLQRACYSGHKRFHCLIYQTVTTPDGLMFHLYGPEVGRRHDMTLYRQSGMDQQLQSTMVIGGRQYCLYGDPAYILRAWLQVAYDRASATAEQLVYNKGMSSVREAVEWAYKDLKQIWSSQDYKRMLRVRKSPIALLYKAAALLWNVRVCLHHGSGQTSSYFSCPPPSLSRYLIMP